MRCLVFALTVAVVSANNQHLYDYLNSLYPTPHDPPKYEPENPPKQSSDYEPDHPPKQPDYEPDYPSKQPDYPPQPDYPHIEEVETYEEPSKPVQSVPVASPHITVTNMNNVRTNMFCSSIDSSVIAANPTLRYMCNQRNSAFIGGAAQVDRTPRNLAGAAALNTALGLNLATGLAGNAGAGLNQGITVTNMNNVATNLFCSRISAAELTVNPTLAAMCNQVRSAAIAGATQVRDSRSSAHYPEYPQYPVEPVYPTAPAYPDVHPTAPVYPEVYPTPAPAPAYPEVYPTVHPAPTYPVPALYPVPVPAAVAASTPISVTNLNNVATNMFCSTMSVEQLTANPTLASMCNQAFSAAIAGAGQVVDDRAPRSSDPHHYYPAPVPAVQPVVPAISQPITVTNMNNVFTNMYCSSLSVEQLTLNPTLASMCNQVRSAAISGATQVN